MSYERQPIADHAINLASTIQGNLKRSLEAIGVVCVHSHTLEDGHVAWGSAMHAAKRLQTPDTPVKRACGWPSTQDILIGAGKLVDNHTVKYSLPGAPQALLSAEAASGAGLLLRHSRIPDGGACASQGAWMWAAQSRRATS